MDKVQVIKWESINQGGSQDNVVPTEINPNEDALDVRGIYFQDGISNDKAVSIERGNDGKLNFVDKEGGSYSLAQLASGGFIIDDVLVNQYGAALSNQEGNLLLKG